MSAYEFRRNIFWKIVDNKPLTVEEKAFITACMLYNDSGTTRKKEGQETILRRISKFVELYQKLKLDRKEKTNNSRVH